MGDEIEDLMLDIAWRDYDACSSDKRDIENKSSVILATNGVLLGLILRSNS